MLLEPFKNLVSVNGAVSFGVERDQADSKEDNRRGLVGGVRKLLMFEGGEEGERRLTEEVAIAKQKELNRDRDSRKALEKWECGMNHPSSLLKHISSLTMFIGRSLGRSLEMSLKRSFGMEPAHFILI